MRRKMRLKGVRIPTVRKFERVGEDRKARG